MPVFTSASSVPLDEKTHVALSFDGINKKVSMHLPNSSPEVASYDRVSDHNAANQMLPHTIPSSEPGMYYQQTLINGDIVHSTGPYLQGKISNLFGVPNDNDWSSAWYTGDNSDYKMTGIYEFTSGSKLIGKMNFTQVFNYHPTDNIEIFYWNGTEYVNVSNPSSTGFIGVVYLEEIEITFDPVLSTKFKCIFYYTSNFPGLSEWSLYAANTLSQTAVETFDTNVGAASDMIFNINNMVLGKDYTGVMSNVELTYGINSAALIESYSFSTADNPIFGYRFDTYKTGTNDSFVDSIGTFDLKAVNISGIKLVDDSYMKYVSSVEFVASEQGYLASQTDFVDPYSSTDPVSLLFWVKKGSSGTIYHLDNQMTVSMSADNTMNVNFVGDGKQFSIASATHNTTNHPNFTNNDWVFVGIDAINKNCYVNGALVSSTAGTAQTTVGNNKIHVGGRGANEYFNGRLDGIFGVPSMDAITVTNAYEQFNNDDAYVLSTKALDATLIQSGWTHIATTYNKVSKDLSVYHNGQLFTTYRNYIPNMNDSNIVQNSNNLLIGKQPEYSTTSVETHYDGIMDDIRIYENPLNENDVNSIYAQYYQPGNEGANALMDASFELTSVTPSFNGELVTLSATSPSNVLWKAVCIADHNYNSRELIEKVINNSDLSSAVESFAESTSLTGEPMSNVVVIQESTPDLVFDTKPINYVNSFDVFVYAYSSSYSLESVKRQSVVSSTDPMVLIVNASTTEFSMSVFTPLNEVTKYYVYTSTNATETVETMTTSGTSVAISVTRNQVKAFTNVSFISSNYLHVLVEDIQGGVSSVVTIQV